MTTSDNRRLQDFLRATSTAAVLLSVGLPVSAAEPWLNFQGQTGLVEIPDARTISSQEILLHFNNDFQSDGRQIDNAQNYVFGYGLLPGLELSGRLAVAENDDGTRLRTDLSGNAKWRLLDTQRFGLAAGVQDFGGDAVNFQSRYGVGTAELGPVELSLGYGLGPDRLDGPFGGVSLNLGRWGRVALEHDGEHARIGAGLRYRFLDRAEAVVSSKLYSQDDEENLSVGLSLRFALGKPAAPIDSARVEHPRAIPSGHTDAHRTKIAANDARSTAVEVEATPTHAAPAATNDDAADRTNADDARKQTARSVSTALTNAGLSRVRVGEDSGGRTVVKFENRRFWHSQLDGFQVVRQILQDLGVDAHGWVLLEEKNGVPRSAVVLDGGLGGRSLAWNAPRTEDIEWTTAEPRSPFGVELRIEPRLATLVGTEFGTFDYDLALQPSLRFLLGHGLSVHGAAVIEAARSDTYRDGAFRDRQQKSGFDEAFVQWTHRPHPAYTGLVSGGIQRLGDDDFSVLDYEGAWHSPTGRHQLHAHLTRYDDLERSDQRNLAIGSYRYWWWERDLSLALAYGQFFDETLGARAILRRYIGDVIVGLFYARDEDGRQAGGLSISLPLTPRVGVKPFHGAYVVGQPRWQYAVSTTIDGPNGRNVLRPDFLTEPTRNYNLRRDFLDADRALPGYIDKHWQQRVSLDPEQDIVTPSADIVVPCAVEGSSSRAE